MPTTIAPPDHRTDHAEHIIKAVRADLLVAMRMLDHGSTREAQLRLTMAVAALDDTLEEMGR